MATSRGKFTKYKIMKAAAIRQPATNTLTKSSFDTMLRSYSTIIVKPSFGSGGVGIKKVSYIGNNKYVIQSGTIKRTIVGRSDAYNYVKNKAGKTSHVVQQYIRLASINGRPLDFRVMAQRKKGGSWTITGKLAKVAGANHIITNVARSGGYVLPASTALSRVYSSDKANRVGASMEKTALRAASQLGKTYGIRIIGFDIGVDHKGREWVIEPNFTPNIHLFLRLKDKSAYYTILRYK